MARPDPEARTSIADRVDPPLHDQRVGLPGDLGVLPVDVLANVLSMAGTQGRPVNGRCLAQSAT